MFLNMRSKIVNIEKRAKQMRVFLILVTNISSFDAVIVALADACDGVYVYCPCCLRRHSLPFPSAVHDN